MAQYYHMDISTYKLLNTFIRNHGSIRSLKFYIQVNNFLYCSCSVIVVLSHFLITKKKVIFCVSIPHSRAEKNLKPLDVQNQQLSLIETQMQHRVWKHHVFRVYRIYRCICLCKITGFAQLFVLNNFCKFIYVIKLS